MHLLTAIAHEVGHLLGFDHSEVGVIDDTLRTGMRRMPAAVNAADNAAVESAIVDSILAIDWTGWQKDRKSDELLDSLFALRHRDRLGSGM